MSWLKHSDDFHDLVDVETIRATLIAWFASSARPLPWRDEALPNRAYAVLVSASNAASKSLPHASDASTALVGGRDYEPTNAH